MTTAKTPATPKPRKAVAPRKTASKPSAPAPEPPKPPEAVTEAPETILIHFVAEGFSAFGHVWSKGQELEIKVPSPEYSRTCDINGDSWLRVPPEDQAVRWGEVKFMPGPSEIPNSVINFRPMSADGVDSYRRPKYNGYMSQSEREKAAEAEKARGRNVPTV